MEVLPSLEGSSSREPPASLRFKDTPSSPQRRQGSMLPQLQRRSSIVSTYRNDLYRPKIVTFMKNGDKFFKGVKMNVSSRKIRTWDVLLSELSRYIDLPAGVRQIYTPESGHRVSRLNLFEHQQTYVCASTEPFKKMCYSKAKTLAWNSGTKSKKLSQVETGWDLSRSMYQEASRLNRSLGTSLRSNNDPRTTGRAKKRTRQQLSVQLNQQPPISFQQQHQQEQQEQQHHLFKGSQWKKLPSVFSPSEPAKLTIICNGPPPRKVVTVLLNRQTLSSWEQACSIISDSLQLNKGCLRLYSVDGVEVESLSQLWKTSNVLIAVGQEEFDMGEFLKMSRGTAGGEKMLEGGVCMNGCIIN